MRFSENISFSSFTFLTFPTNGAVLLSFHTIFMLSITVQSVITNRKAVESCSLFIERFPDSILSNLNCRIVPILATPHFYMYKHPHSNLMLHLSVPSVIPSHEIHLRNKNKKHLIHRHIKILKLRSNPCYWITISSSKISVTTTLFSLLWKRFPCKGDSYFIFVSVRI